MRCIIPIVVVVTTAWLSFGCSTPPTSRTQPTAAFEFVELIMASPARLTICTDDETQARRAARAAFDRMHQIERILSSWMTNSQSNRLVRAWVASDVRRRLQLGQHEQRGTDARNLRCAHDWTACRELFVLET